MNRNIILKTAGLLFLAAASAVQAQDSFFDDFNRADASDLGSNYTYYNNLTAVSSSFAISSNTAVSTISNPNNAMTIVDASAFQLQVGVGFTLEVDVQSFTTGSNWAGLVFNFQDKDNFHFARWKPVTGQFQILSVVGGALDTSNIAQLTDTNFLTTATSHLTLAGDGSGNYTITMARAGVSDATLNWTDTTFSGGQVGLYYTGGGTGTNLWTFDDFSAVNIPEPATTAMFLGLGALGAIALVRRRK